MEEMQSEKVVQEASKLGKEMTMSEEVALAKALTEDMKVIMNSHANIPKTRMKRGSWPNILPTRSATPNLMKEIPEPVLFSDLIRRSHKEAAEVQFTKKYIGPTIKDCPLPELARKPGHVPVLKYFHLESHREREGSSDDGLYVDDLAAVDKKYRKKVSMNKPKIELHRHSHQREEIVMIKGEFTFIHRTYRPKVQISFKVPAGQVPQSVMIERLQRLYRRTDINDVCNRLGIEVDDLIPPPNYGEHNEKFYHEAMFRCRSKIYGHDRREFIREGGIDLEEDQDGSGKRKRRITKIKFSGLEDEDLDSSEPGEFEDEETKLSVHPFAKSKPPFGAQFPLDFFDNEEFDIRSGEDWIKLGMTKKGDRICPIPGKAFLPLPLLEFRKHLPSLSEATYGNLLEKSKNLQSFREWILKERYIRMNGEGLAPTEAQMALSARASSNVVTVIPDDEDRLRHSGGMELHKKKSRRKTSHGDVVDDPDDLDDSFDDIGDEYDGEEGEGKSSAQSSSVVLNKERGIDDELDEIIEKFRAAKPKRTESDSGIKIDGPVKSESILSDINSDCLSDLRSPEPASMAPSSILAGAKEGDSQQHLDISASAYARAHQKEEGGSPDIDPYEQDGWENYIFEYEKMKKVHIYDWRWTDCGVMDYDPKTRRYLVRSIFPPYCYAWVNKLYVLMDGEDPRHHGERIKDAIIRRIESEYCMRYNLYIDCLPVTEDTPEIFSAIRANILLRTMSTPNLRKSSASMKKIQKEINLEWKRTHMKLHFDEVVQKHPRLYRPWINPLDPKDIPEWEAFPSTTWQPIVDRFKECSTRNFAYKVTRIQRKSVIYKVEPYTALMEIVAACCEARTKPFILSNQMDSISIDDYEHRQKQQMEDTYAYLKDEWMMSVLSSIQIHLEKIPRSWYNIEERRWDVYKMSKVANYLNMIRFLMEDTLAFMVEESLEGFVNELDLLTRGSEGVTSSYEWVHDLKTSDFPPPEGMVPPFTLELTIDQKRGPRYSHLLSKCRVVLAHIYNLCIDSASGLPDIIPQIMKNLLFGVSKPLNSVSRMDEKIVQLKKNMLQFLHRGLIPVDIYAQKYKYYMPVWNLDLTKFLEDWNAVDHTTKEIRHAVDFHIKHLNEIEAEIPSSIDIGCCRINVQLLKTELLRRKKNLYMGILDSFATKLKNQILAIKEEYDAMEKKLSDRSDDIEVVMALKAYVETVPRTLMIKGEIITKILKDYDLFLRYKYPIPAIDVETKWTVALGTNRLTRMCEDAVGFLEDDYDRLLKVQQADLSSLSDTVDSTTLSVSGLVAYVEIEKAIEVSQEVKKLWKQVKEIQETSELLNRRQLIFGLPPAQNEALVRLGNDIEPYKYLWLTAADWNRLKESVFNATLDKVDIEAVHKMVTEGAKVIRHCIKFFEGSDVIQHIAEEIYHEIKTFRPLVPLIRTLKNPGMRQRHWEEISHICGYTVVAKGNQSFKKLLDEGLKDFADPISKVGDKATEEAKIEVSMDKMAYEINLFKIQVETDPNSGVQIAKIPPEVTKTIAEDIKRTNQFLVSPYKVPFEERLDHWDKKLRLTRENLVTWQEVQKEWIQMQEDFKIPDFALKLPAEHKLFQKLERIWRRIFRLVRDMPNVLDVGSDTTLRASLSQFALITEKCKKGLAEFMKPSNSDSDEDIPNKSDKEPKEKAAPAGPVIPEQADEDYMPPGFMIRPPERKTKLSKVRSTFSKMSIRSTRSGAVTEVSEIPAPPPPTAASVAKPEDSAATNDLITLKAPDPDRRES